MVADATAKPQTTPKSLISGKRGGRKPGVEEFPMLTRLKARNLYLIQGVSHETIAKATGLTVRQSETLASREGWAKLRKDRKQRLLASQDAHDATNSNEAIEAIGALSEQLAVRGLERVGESVERKGKFAARDFQSWSGGVRNLVGVIRDIRRPTADFVSDRAHVNLFFFGAPNVASAANLAGSATAPAPGDDAKPVAQVELRPDEARRIE